MVSSLSGLTDFCQSELYSHMPFHRQSDISTLAFLLKKGLEDESVDYLREDDRFQQITEKLERLSKAEE